MSSNRVAKAGFRDKDAPKRETQKITNMTANLADGCVRLLWVKSKGESASLRVPRSIDDDGGVERCECGESIRIIPVRRQQRKNRWAETTDSGKSREE
jgi:hypothetical protein